MAQQHSTTATTSASLRQHKGHWVTGQRDLFCEKCGWPIQAGEWFLFFHWFPGRQYKGVCMACAVGPEPSGPSPVVDLDDITFPEVA